MMIVLWSQGLSINEVWTGDIHKFQLWDLIATCCAAWFMVCRSPTDRKNASVGLKSEWSWNMEKSQAYFPFLGQTFHSSIDCLASLRSARQPSFSEWQVLPPEWKVCLPFFLFLDIHFPALQNIYSVWYQIQTTHPVSKNEYGTLGQFIV